MLGASYLVPGFLVDAAGEDGGLDGPPAPIRRHCDHCVGWWNFGSGELRDAVAESFDLLRGEVALGNAVLFEAGADGIADEVLFGAAGIGGS